MVFVLDNYDSFTYNLVQYIGELGAGTVVRRNDDLTVDEIEALAPDRIVISPGPCTPQEAGISIEVVRHFTGKLPILGVCLGHQAIGAAFGGVIARAPVLMHGKTSRVEHDGMGVFAGLPTPMVCTRYHSLIVAEEGLPPELAITAWAVEDEDENGEERGRREGKNKGAQNGQHRNGPHRNGPHRGTIMGLRHRRFPVEGVQFHPESVLTVEGKRLIQNFLSL